jgi:uncharacterized membrane protein YidH (DUF202 family)
MTYKHHNILNLQNITDNNYQNKAIVMDNLLILLTITLITNITNTFLNCVQPERTTCAARNSLNSSPYLYIIYIIVMMVIMVIRNKINYLAITINKKSMVIDSYT